MKATVYHGPRDVRVEEVPDATIRTPTDALVRVTHACICGSDLWPYRGELEIYGRPGRTGHEFMGVVEAAAWYSSVNSRSTRASAATCSSAGFSRHAAAVMNISPVG